MSAFEPMTELARATSSAATGGLLLLIQSTIVVGCGLVVAKLARKRGPAVQSACYRTTLAAALLAPAVWFLFGSAGAGAGFEIVRFHVPTWPQARLVKPAASTSFDRQTAESGIDFRVPAGRPHDPSTIPQLPMSDVTAFDGHNVMSPVAHGASTGLTSVVPGLSLTATAADFQGIFFEWATHGLCLAWVALSAMLLLRTVRSILAAKRLIRSARDAEPSLVDRCGKLAREFALEPPFLKRSPFINCACVFGWRRPVVLLPESDDGVADDVLIHELAHLVRRDCAWKLWAELATALVWFQPLLWSLKARMQEVAEEVCDDYVVASGADRCDYADRLTRIAGGYVPQASAVGIGLFSFRSTLGRRVGRILDSSRRLQIRASRKSVGALVSGSLALVIAASLIDVGRPINPADAADRGALSASTRAASSASFGAASKPVPSMEEKGETVTVRGRVLGPDGRPAAGANVSAVYADWTPLQHSTRLASIKTDALGRFELTFPKLRVPHHIVLFGNSDWALSKCIVAERTGFGPDTAWLRDIDKAQPLELKLAPDVAISGRLVDLEGKPVQQATVRVGIIAAPKDGNLGPWLNAVRHGEFARRKLDKSIHYVQDELASPITTDADGRFRLAGVGKDRVVSLTFTGETIAVTHLNVVTRPIETMQERVYADLDLNETHPVVGPDFRITAGRTRPIVGTVRDATNGRPLAGVRITSDKFAGSQVSGIRVLSTASDQNGRFRLVGMPKGAGNAIDVFPDGQPYIARRLRIPEKPGLEPLSFDIELHRGIWIAGHVTDRVTGAPQLARIIYCPLRTNPSASRLREFTEQELPVGPGNGIENATSADGTYRIVGLPGPALIGAWCMSGDYLMGVGFDDLKSVKPDENGHLNEKVFSNGTPAPSRKWPNLVKEIAPPAETTAARCDFALDPGDAIRVTVLDPSGFELPGCTVQGRTPWGRYEPAQRRSQFDVVCLTPNDSRTVLIHHEKRNLGKSLRLRSSAGAARTLTVRLEPCATIVGRAVDGEGLPVSGLWVDVAVLPQVDYSLSLRRVDTGHDGRFRHTGILPGLEYSVLLRAGPVGVVAARRRLSVKPGESIDLGDIIYVRPR